MFGKFILQFRQIKQKEESFDIEKNKVEGDEKDKPPVFTTLIIVSVSFFLVLLVWLFAEAILDKSVAVSRRITDTGEQNSFRISYLAKEKEILENYSRKKDGIYTVPIEKAMELVVHEYASK